MPADRELTAFHEAGHAVAAVALGCPVRYVSLRPRGARLAGHVVGRWRDERRPQWLPDLITAAAGMVAEDALRRGEDRRITVESGRADLLRMRQLARYAWHRANPDDAYEYHLDPLDPAIDPAWTVFDIASHAWRQAHLVLAQRGDALWAVADELERSRRALTGAQIRWLVAEADTDADTEDPPLTPAYLEAAVDQIEFWPACYSRLNWTVSTVKPQDRTTSPSAGQPVRPVTDVGHPTAADQAAEVTRLVSAKDYAANMTAAHTAAAAGVEMSTSSLAGFGVSGEVIAAADQAAEAQQAAAAAWRRAHAALTAQSQVAEAYDAAPGAGTRAFVTA